MFEIEIDIKSLPMSYPLGGCLKESTLCDVLDVGLILEIANYGGKT